jgi:hypothetical protein
MKFERLTLGLATLAIASLGAAGRISAQTNCSNPVVGSDVLLGATVGSGACSVTNTVSLTLGKYATLSINNATTTLATPSAAQFGDPAGVTTTGPTVTVSSNTGWTLTASAAAGWTGTGNNSKPVTDIKAKVGSGSFTAFPFTAGTNPGASSAATVAMSYNTIYNFLTDTPGTYSLIVTYSLTAP